MDYEKENIFKNIKDVNVGKRQYRILDDDGRFIRVIPQFITGSTKVPEGLHIERIEDNKNMGNEVFFYIEFLDENYNYYPEGHVVVNYEQFRFVTDEVGTRE